MAFGPIWSDAPTGSIVAFCSSTSTSTPRRASASAAVRPPIPPPTIAILTRMV